MNVPEQHVLMVEDSSDDVTLTLHSFKKHGFPYPVVVASDGAAALKLLFGPSPDASGERPKPPLLVLLDLNIPKVMGFEVLQQIRDDAYLKTLPVIILTSSNEEKDRAEAQRLKADLYIRKPIDYNDFALVTQQIKDFLTSRVAEGV